jgi:DNA-binding NarL/FixJ family response regulator
MHGAERIMTKTTAQILIVDDHPVLRHGLAELIERAPDLQVCGEAGGVSDALQLCHTEKPDLVLIDMSLEDGHGLDLIRDLQTLEHPPRMLVISMHEEATYVERALRAGAHGFLPKSEAVDEIVYAIRQVLRGEVYLNRRMTTCLLNGMVGGRPREGTAPHEILSDRELQVFEMLGRGLSTRQISEQLMLSIKTIDTYREHVKQKLGLKSANELVLRAILWVHEPALARPTA